MKLLARLARVVLSIPSRCPNCGERTRHGHWVKPGPSTPGYWACEPFVQRRERA